MLVGFEFWLGLGSDLGFLNKWVLLREGHLSEGVSPQGCSQTSRRTHQEYRNNRTARHRNHVPIKREWLKSSAFVRFSIAKIQKINK